MSEILSVAHKPTDDELAKIILWKIVVGESLTPDDTEVLRKFLLEAVQEMQAGSFQQSVPPEHTILLSSEEQAVLEVIKASGDQASAAWHKEQKREARRVLPEAERFRIAT